MAHPDVDSSEGPGAAVVAAAHDKYGERPLLVVKLRSGATTSKQDLLDFFQGKCAKWWIPDDVVFLESNLPLTGTGKTSKLELRKLLADYVLPGQ